MQIPRNETLAEALYRDIDTNAYLNEIYNDLLYNYSIRLFKLQRQMREIPIVDALRFADLLAKSTYPSKCDIHKLWGQEIIILLSILYPEDAKIQYYLGSVLSAVGNYRGLKTASVENFQSADVLDGLYYDYDKAVHQIPGLENEYFFREQKNVYDALDKQYFSYSGPTSMGKSFVIQTYIQQQILNESTKNYAILVPTKALINEVRSNIIGSLQKELNHRNYRVVTSAGDIVLKQNHHFVFVMTPERLLHMLIGMSDIRVDFLFIDEAHKISERGGRSSYYYKVIAQLAKMEQRPTVIFASPNIPNPEIYLSLIPGIKASDVKKLASKYTPVCQFKYYLDLIQGKVFLHNDYNRSLSEFATVKKDTKLGSIISLLGKNKQNVVYCNSRSKVVDFAVEYAETLKPINDKRLISLANDIRNEVHNDCYLADLITKGVAYHVGYLPANIRLRIEKSFEDGAIRTMFCTSTLVEGVNLPADNLFITSYRNGITNMNEVEFRNLVGRVGRIKYNLYGNVFFVRNESNLTTNMFQHLLHDDVPPQEVSLNIKENKKCMDLLVKDLAEGDVELSSCHEAATEKDFEALRKFALILSRDLATDTDTPLREAFSPYLCGKEQLIVDNFPVEKTSDDITLSYDQAQNLKQLIQSGQKYPTLSSDDDVDFEEVVAFLMKLRSVFKWNIYEKETIGRPGTKTIDGVLRWYANILLRWIRGYGLSQIIHQSIRYKEQHPETGVWIGKHKICDYYVKTSKAHKNYIIAETLGVIENILLFSISNYFRKFSLEYKEYHKVEHFENDWYEYIEYGTTNPLRIFLQQSGFSREVSSFMLKPANKSKYLTEVNGEPRIYRTILQCGDIGVETEAQDIQFNMPELFVDK